MTAILTSPSRSAPTGLHRGRPFAAALVGVPPVLRRAGDPDVCDMA
ncbi:hypothetical protein OV079_48385 [Nannocystis pusilla]|uniref:Uncharacterized protein n=1 Tax=Nannocystis pusilla TaxID=889268 RepID=A0A9X3F245_9BACT|nr:hypothetical protein [Nannocystis pusilla]MCY1013224.1 hypothetical protein [Nannocystis pusilla]